MTGVAGGGKVSVDVQGAWDEPRAKAKVHTEAARLNVGSLLVAVSTDVAMDLSRDGPRWLGNVDLEKVLVVLPDGSGKGRLPIRSFDDVVYVDDITGFDEEDDPDRAAKPKADAVPYLLSIQTVQPIVVRGVDVDTTARAELKIEPRGGAASITGEVAVVEGRLTILGHTYDIERGAAMLDGAVPPDPRLAARLVKQFETVTFYVDAGGTASEPTLGFSSNPSRYTEAELLGIFLGSTPDDSAAGANKDKAAGAAMSLLVGQVTSRLRGALPVDTVNLEMGDDEAQPSGVTVGKWITDDVFVSYTHRFDARRDQNANQGTIRWRFSPGWVVEGVVGDFEHSGDVLWVRRF